MGFTGAWLSSAGCARGVDTPVPGRLCDSVSSSVALFTAIDPRRNVFQEEQAVVFG